MDEKKIGRFCEWTRREFLCKFGMVAGFSSFSSSLATFLLHPVISAPFRGKMEKRKLGRTGLNVSVISFGGGVIGAPHIPDDTMVSVVRTAIDSGVNLLDTAPIYGYSEVRIGKAIKKYPREEVFLATKVESESHQWLREEAEQLIRRSLFWMDVPYIDLVQFHGVGSEEALKKILSRGGALEGVKSAKKKGLVKFIGITGGHNSAQMEVLIKGVETGEFDVVFPSYNIEFPDAGQPGGLFDVAKKYETGVMVKKALIRQGFPQAPGMPRKPPGSLIPRYGISTLLKFVLKDPRIDTLVVGMSRISEVEEDVPFGYLPSFSSPQEKGGTMVVGRGKK